MTERSYSFARGRVVAALVGAGLLLSACQGGSPTPGNSPSASSASASASATPTPSPSAKYVPASAKGKAQNVPVPVKPALADQNSKAGLEAFTKYWFALLSYGYETGDLTEWSKVSSEGCVYCSNLSKAITGSYADDQWITGGKISTPSIDAKTKAGAASQDVLVQVIQEPGEYFRPGGVKTRPSEKGSNTAVVVSARYKDGAWLVSDLAPVVG